MYTTHSCHTHPSILASSHFCHYHLVPPSLQFIFIYAFWDVGGVGGFLV